MHQNQTKKKSSSSSSKPFSLFAPTVAEVNLVSSFARWRYISMIKNIYTGVFEILSSVEINDGILSKLNYLIDLGINAIKLLPIQGISKNKNTICLFYFINLFVLLYNKIIWVMNMSGVITPTHHFAIKTSYGTKNDLKKLVDECHKHSIRYHKEEYHRKDSYYCGPRFNYDYYDEILKIKPAVKYARDIILYWIEEFHFDGIRFDASKLI
ncbi:unnamed protein product [Rotaria sp. Silwood1]|nr:unnamed protein product [Rotaria sp. Silwood1]